MMHLEVCQAKNDERISFGVSCDTWRALHRVRARLHCDPGCPAPRRASSHARCKSRDSASALCLCPGVLLPPLLSHLCSSLLSSNKDDCLCVLHPNCTHVFAILCDGEACRCFPRQLSSSDCHYVGCGLTPLPSSPTLNTLNNSSIRYHVP